MSRSRINVEVLAPSGGVRASTAGSRRPNLCDHCRSGDHHLCTGVGCYGCPGPHRRHGCAVPVATSGRQPIVSDFEDDL